MNPGGAHGPIGLPFNSFWWYEIVGYAFCVLAFFDLRIRNMTRDIPAARTIGIPAPKPAAKAILGFMLLEDKVCGPGLWVNGVVVEEAAEVTDRREVVVLGIKATPCGAAVVEVIATSMVVYGER
jgi:hypothetical protein